MAAAAAEAAAARQKRMRLDAEAAAVGRGTEGGAAGRAEDMAVDAMPTLDSLFRKTAAKPAIYWLPLTEEEVARKKRREREFGQREPPPGMGMDPRDHRDFGDAWRSSGLEPLAYHGPSAALPPPPALPLPPPRSPPRSNSRRGELPDNSWGRRRR
uniref:Uncharacterized protein n=1 Tax=Dunaliella tertiolecta TaxID=3047 RepID=A0A7S3QPV0_DUNTE